MTAMSDRHVQKPYPLRMPKELRDMLEASAKRDGRSLNAEIVSRLEASFSETNDERVSISAKDLSYLAKQISDLMKKSSY